MKVSLFGKLADVLGRELEVPVPGDCSIRDLRARIAAEHPQAAEALCSRRVRACVGDAIVTDDHVVSPGSHVEFLPPVSGG